LKCYREVGTILRLAEKRPRAARAGTCPGPTAPHEAKPVLVWRYRTNFQDVNITESISLNAIKLL